MAFQLRAHFPVLPGNTTVPDELQTQEPQRAEFFSTGTHTSSVEGLQALVEVNQPIKSVLSCHAVSMG